MVWDERGRFSDDGEPPFDIVSVYRPEPKAPAAIAKPAKSIKRKVRK